MSIKNTPPPNPMDGTDLNKHERNILSIALMLASGQASESLGVIEVREDGTPVGLILAISLPQCTDEIKALAESIIFRSLDTARVEATIDYES